MYHTILHATDLSEQHIIVAEKAVELASKLQARLHLLHVIEIPKSLMLAQGLGFAQILTPMEAEVRTVLQTLGDAYQIPIEQQHVLVGDVRTQVEHCIQNIGANLLVIANHQEAFWPMFIGSTAYNLTRHSHCDLMILQI
ncbi:MAG: universal stress protein [Legionellaceae bacterium]|nr:universal stress protein [Legionellaceae bacterium]